MWETSRRRRHVCQIKRLRRNVSETKGNERVNVSIKAGGKLLCFSSIFSVLCSCTETDKWRTLPLTRTQTRCVRLLGPLRLSALITASYPTQWSRTKRRLMLGQLSVTALSAQNTQTRTVGNVSRLDGNRSLSRWSAPVSPDWPAAATNRWKMRTFCPEKQQNKWRGR